MVVPDARSQGSRLETEPGNETDADTACTTVPLDAGQLEDVVLDVGNDLAVDDLGCDEATLSDYLVGQRHDAAHLARRSVRAPSLLQPQRRAAQRREPDGVPHAGCITAARAPLHLSSLHDSACSHKAAVLVDTGRLEISQRVEDNQVGVVAGSDGTAARQA